MASSASAVKSQFKNVIIIDSNVPLLALVKMNMKHQKLGYMYGCLLLTYLSFHIESGKNNTFQYLTSVMLNGDGKTSSVF